MSTNFHPHRTIIRAWADGAEIEWYNQKEGRWVPCLDQGLSTPSFDKNTAYRVRSPNIIVTTDPDGIVTAVDLI